VPDGWYLSGEPSQAAITQDVAAETRSAAKRPAGKLSVSTTEMAAISNARPNLNIGIDLWSNSPVKAETSGPIQINAAAPSHDVPLSHMVSFFLKVTYSKYGKHTTAICMNNKYFASLINIEHGIFPSSSCAFF